MRVVAWEAPTLCFSSTSEAKLEVQNGEVETRWYLSSFAPPYVKVHFYLYYITSIKSFISVYYFFFSYFWNKCLSFAVLAQLIVINLPHEFASNTVIFFFFVSPILTIFYCWPSSIGSFSLLRVLTALEVFTGQLTPLSGAPGSPVHWERMKKCW